MQINRLNREKSPALRPDSRYISYRHDLYSNTDQILFHSPFTSFLLFSSSCSEQSFREKTVAFQIQNM